MDALKRAIASLNRRKFAPARRSRHLPLVVERNLGARQLTGAPAHRLVRWLHAHGADEFSVCVLALQETQAPFVDAFEDAFAPYALPDGERPVLDGPLLVERLHAVTGHPDESASAVCGTRRIRLWSLCTENLPLLLSFCDDGILEWPVGPDGWFEDFTIYRDGALVLGVVSDERAGVVRVTPREYAALVREGHCG